MQRTYAEDLQVGQLIHDENGPITFVPTHIDVRENSVMVTGKQLVHPPFGSSESAVWCVPYTTMYIKGDNGLWNLSA